MVISKTPPYNPNFGIRIKPTKTSYYYPNCYIEKEVGLFNGKQVILSKNFMNDKLTSRLIYIKDETGKWLKSKLKYLEDGQWKVLKGESNV
jgi:hypothetical protein